MLEYDGNTWQERTRRYDKIKWHREAIRGSEFVKPELFEKSLDRNRKSVSYRNTWAGFLGYTAPWSTSRYRRRCRCLDPGARGVLDRNGKRRCCRCWLGRKVRVDIFRYSTFKWRLRGGGGSNGIQGSSAP